MQIPKPKHKKLNHSYFIASMLFWEINDLVTIKNWCFQVVVLGKTLESPLDCKEINQSVLKEINPEYSLEGMMLKWSSNTLAAWCEKPTHWKRPWHWQKEKGAADDEMVTWHHWLNGHEHEQISGDSEGQGSLVHCSPQGHRQDLTNEHHQLILLWHGHPSPQNIIYWLQAFQNLQFKLLLRVWVLH